MELVLYVLILILGYYGVKLEYHRQVTKLLESRKDLMRELQREARILTELLAEVEEKNKRIHIFKSMTP